MGLDVEVVGFDARTMLPERWSSWTKERRDRYLIRPDVERPLSTDTSVWPSLFDAGIKRPAWTGALGLWDDLARLEDELALAGEAVREPYWVVAVSLLWAFLKPDEQSAWMNPPKLAGGSPEALNSNWTLIGYDVADMFLLSGISNCGFEWDEMQKARTRWRPQLNEHSLFREASAAQAFKFEADSRVAEHAPFSVFGIHLVRKSPCA